MDELDSPSGNPCGRIDDEDVDGPLYVARGGVMPWEISSSSTARQHPAGDKKPHYSITFNLERYADALRAIPSGNPCARAQDDDTNSDSATSANPYCYIDSTSSDPQPYYASGDRMPWQVLDKQQPSLLYRVQMLSQTGSHRRRRARHTDQQIEEVARYIQRELWRRREELFGETNDPIRVLSPAKVLELSGYRVRYRHGGLGRVEQDGATFEVAGVIDPVSKMVDISTLPSPTEQLYTLTHELGHVVLNSMGSMAHRDRPLSGARTTRDFHERAADKFAAYFLMPEKLLRRVFWDCYLTSCFVLTDETAFALRASSLDDVCAEFPTLRTLSCYLASAEHYNGRVFRSLASIFNVSPVAMAIRLEELGLVSGPAAE